jgi:hypothetical protein
LAAAAWRQRGHGGRLLLVDCCLFLPLPWLLVPVSLSPLRRRAAAAMKTPAATAMAGAKNNNNQLNVLMQHHPTDHRQAHLVPEYDLVI